MLPDGTVKKVHPFHFSLEGMESNLLCRDDGDYDFTEKQIYIIALRKNVVIVSHIVMSNHAHATVLAASLEQARAYSREVKRICSLHLSQKYGEKSALAGLSEDIRYLDDDRYVRNTLAYIPRNALDAGFRVEDYPWSSYRAMFADGKCINGRKAVSAMTRREREDLLYTHSNLKNCKWILNDRDNLEPASACCYEYLESAFNGDQSFFLKTIGSVNMPEMNMKLLKNPRAMRSDSEFRLLAMENCERLFGKTLDSISVETKLRLVQYRYNCYRTTTAQLARCVKLSRDDVEAFIGKRKII